MIRASLRVAAAALAVLAVVLSMSTGCADLLGVDFGTKQSAEAGTGGAGGSAGTGPDCTKPEDCNCAGTKCVCQDGKCKSECTTTTDCKNLHNNAAWACISGACAELESIDCASNDIDGQWDAEDPPPLFIGVLEDKTSKFASPKQIEYYLVPAKLARKQIEAAVTGPGKRPRKVVFLVCDEAQDAVRAAKHLVEDVGVRVLIGPSRPDAQLAVFNQVVKPREALATSVSMFTRAAFPAFLESPQNTGLGWSCAPSFGVRAIAAAKLIEEEEANIRALHGLGPADPMRVALVTSDDPGHDQIADKIVELAKIAGKPIKEQSTVQYQKIYSPDPNACTGDASCDYEAPKQALLTLRPHLVITYAPHTLYSQVIRPMEKEWDNPGAPLSCADGGAGDSGVSGRPFYVSASWDFSIANTVQCPSGLPVAVDFPSRIRALDFYPPDEDRYMTFINDLFAETGPFTDIDLNVVLSYDCAYLIEYALTFALRADELANVNATVIADALKVLQPAFPGDGSQVVHTGKSEIAAADGALDLGKRIDLQGLYGSLHLDPVFHAPLYDLHVMCAKKSPSEIYLPGKPSGRRYVIKDGQFTGTYACE